MERLARGETDAAALPRRESPHPVVTSERRPTLVDDVSRRRLDAVPGEERPVVVPGEEARLLALGSTGCREASSVRLAPDLAFVSCPSGNATRSRRTGSTVASM
jgi:hypothetical protein